MNYQLREPVLPALLLCLISIGCPLANTGAVINISVTAINQATGKPVEALGIEFTDLTNGTKTGAPTEPYQLGETDASGLMNVEYYYQWCERLPRFRETKRSFELGIVGPRCARSSKRFSLSQLEEIDDGHYRLVVNFTLDCEDEHASEGPSLLVPGP
jgi:hypothetical protein